MSTGIIAGTIGITFAHELVHRPGAFELALGEILLASTSYAHFAIEHVRPSPAGGDSRGSCHRTVR